MIAKPKKTEKEKMEKFVERLKRTKPTFHCPKCKAILFLNGGLLYKGFVYVKEATKEYCYKNRMKFAENRKKVLQNIRRYLLKRHKT